MARYRKVDSRIWNDAKFCSLSDSGKLVFLFLLTHPNMTALGAMRATIPGLAAEMGWSEKAFAEALGEAFQKAMAKHDQKACFLWLPNFLKYNKPESPNVVKAWESALDLLPECGLKDQLIQHVKDYVEGLTEGFQKALPEAFAKAMPIQEQEQEQEQEGVPGGEAPPPNVWDIWLGLTGSTNGNRSFLGKQIKSYGEESVAQAVATLSTRRPPPADPKQFLVGMLRGDYQTPQQELID